MTKRILFVFMIAFAFTACKKDKSTTVTTETTTDGTTEVVETKEAPNEYVWWKGDKVMGTGSHNGKILFSDVNFIVQDGKLAGGEFEIDMSTISSDDLEGEKAETLIGDLKSKSFFEVDTYPTAKFKILEVEAPTDDSGLSNVTGSLTIKGVTKNITVPAKITVSADGKVSYESEFTLDRTDFNVNYGSPTKITDVAKDKAIKDEVEIKVVLNS